MSDALEAPKRSLISGLSTYTLLDKTFHIYRSSAGSGKTRTLAREYILLALRHPDDFKYSLAVSFANKSSQEMKDRVINYLGDFAKGEGEDGLRQEIQEALKVDAAALQEKSKEVLSRILHQYSQFSISTIDAFFQRVIRSFTRESGLLGNFRLEAEDDRVMGEVIAELMDELGADHPQLTDWVIQFSRERLVEGENWNITESLKTFSKEILKDEYKVIAEDIQRVGDKISFPEFLGYLQKEKRKFFADLKLPAQRALSLLATNGITSDDFNYKESGTAFSYFNRFSKGVFVEAKPRILESAVDPSSWPSKKSPRNALLKQLASTQLMPILNEMVEYVKTNLIHYHTADLVEKNFYEYGLLMDIDRKLKQYKAENNLMLLSDASHFLNGIINNSDTPFIYEKVGSFYRHYLIDEFQDTSRLQWRNFEPLFRNSLDENNQSMVVGDVKQSIYRWRGSELSLLQETVQDEIGTDRTLGHSLDENWRSAENLVLFNNALFTIASQQVGIATNHPLPVKAFHDTVQKPVKFKEKGFVRIKFLKNWGSREEESGEDLALREIPHMLEELQAKGIELRDITILVRKNKEGQRIADFLLNYKKSPDAKPNAKYDVVSNESLRIDAASSVLLLISALKYLSNPDDAVARGELVFEFGDQFKKLSPEENEFRFSQAGRKRMKELLPDEFVHHAPWLIKLSLFELTETLIRMFDLGKNIQELAYLQSFQDVVLEFGAKDKNDIASFLEWWEEQKGKRSIQVAANSNAVSIYTIHKAKGLQFKYVIVPFCGWKMDHDIKPLLWGKSDEKPFDELGYVALRYSSELKDSLFAGEYHEEFAKAYLDNLNLLYVAFTRAEEGMMVMAPLPSSRSTEGKISTVGHLVYSAITGSSELQKNFDSSSETYAFGDIEILDNKKPRQVYLPVKLEKYPAVDWRKKLVIRREGTEFFEEPTVQRLRINYGILIHKVMSRIFYKDDVDEVLKGLFFEGVLLEDEMKPMSEKLASLLDHPVSGPWFTKEWQVRTESPVIIPNSQPARIDRVIFKDIQQKGKTAKKAVIIDYKTGAKKEADRRQVEEYARILSRMGYVDVEAHLLYMDSLEIVKVVDKMNLSLF